LLSFPLNYYKFPKSACTSLKKVICHGIPDYRLLKNGDIVNLDATIYHHGYHADLNETYLVGDVNKKDKHLVRSAYVALMKSISICKTGTHYHEIGDLIGEYIESQKLSVIKSYCGYSVYKLCHTT